MSTKEDPGYLKVFAQHKHIYDMFSRSGEMVNFYPHIQAELLQAYREAEDAHYSYSSNCPACVAEFLVKIYQWYDKKISI